MRLLGERVALGRVEAGEPARQDEWSIVSRTLEKELEDEDDDVPLAILLMKRRQEAEKVGDVLKEVSSNVIL